MYIRLLTYGEREGREEREREIHEFIMEKEQPAQS